MHFSFRRIEHRRKLRLFHRKVALIVAFISIKTAENIKVIKVALIAKKILVK